MQHYTTGKKNRAIVLDLINPRLPKEEGEYRRDELLGLCNTFGGAVVVEMIQRRTLPDHRTWIGSGKVEELANKVSESEIDIVICNGTLKPRQLFIIESELRKRLGKNTPQVWDRVDLILKIFAQHAKSAEAKLQITLAGITHLGPRIYRMGLDLSQQGGGIGTRGAGETNTEMMKRHLARLSQTVKKKLKAQCMVRTQHRERRRERGQKTVSIVGYTNAGKSSLMNALTRKGVIAEDVLFSTLDSTMGKLWLPNTPHEVLISDTIGFIENLPPDLIAAFRSTLEEAIYADLILIAVDVSDPFAERKLVVVESILRDLDIDLENAWILWNKCDIADDKKKTYALSLRPNNPSFLVSAITGEGLQEIKNALTLWVNTSK